jgi:cell division protein FtsZ
MKSDSEKQEDRMIRFDDSSPAETKLVPVEGTQPDTLIKVVGVGGGGGNAVNHMIASGIRGVEFISANTDTQALGRNQAAVKIQLGVKLTGGRGCGGKPEVGRQAALEDTEQILEVLDGAEMVFITAGLGGGTGTGGAPIIASLASELGALTVAVVSKPFAFEGRQRMAQADQGLAELRECVDTLISIPNERLLATIERSTPFKQAFSIADDVLRQAVQGISDLITVPGFINLDFADVRNIMRGMGHAVMGTGVASGENRALEAAQKAINCPLLEDSTVDGARGVIINVTGGEDMTLAEVNEACSIIHQGADQDANIIFGAVVDPKMEGQIKITVIATGFPRAETKPRRRGAATPVDISNYTQRAPAREAAAPSQFYRRGTAEGVEMDMDFDSGGAVAEDLDVPTFLRKGK